MGTAEFTKKLFITIGKFDSNQLGIFSSLIIHLLILLFAIGLPDFFKPRPISLPNIIPIEIVNVTDTTSITKENLEKNNEPIEKKVIKQKKFNSSNNVEIKKIEIQEKPEIVKKDIAEVITKKEIVVQDKITPKKIIPEKLKPEIKIEKVESISTTKIKPKLKPKPNKNISINNNSDVQSKPKPLPKPEPDFSIATMLKDLRNEKSNNIDDEEIDKNENIQSTEIKDQNNQSATLSISEIDLLRQQLSSCWNAPAGAVIEKGMNVRISAKIRQNRRVIENSVRIVDTNISKSNSFYGPITESAMRTLLHPECKPLKLPSDKYELWKNLTITFDYSIMKGYSE